MAITVRLFCLILAAACFAVAAALPSNSRLTPSGLFFFACADLFG